MMLTMRHLTSSIDKKKQQQQQQLQLYDLEFTSRL